MATTKFEVKTRLGGGTVEVLFAKSVAEAKALARKTRKDWQRFAPHAQVSYTNVSGKEVYI